MIRHNKHLIRRTRLLLPLLLLLPAPRTRFLIRLKLDERAALMPLPRSPQYTLGLAHSLVLQPSPQCTLGLAHQWVCSSVTCPLASLLRVGLISTHSLTRPPRRRSRFNKHTRHWLKHGGQPLPRTPPWPSRRMMKRSAPSGRTQGRALCGNRSAARRATEAPG